ncbi:sucrase ferredoxin [Rothia sp. ZJ932]|uniref:sucrase ferredoxin n=1 Tax=Rothia sp. ZJ932 TaxID=2810516 RepID=UPI001966EC71|nr:sucrase ferredoxin [Rothia sp. ZJ932]QRZ61640.1 sucrase ferredoxin [Rothia sp. ZJ932]
MSSPRTSPADSCSLLNAEPLPGTASTETVWVCLEHPGNWGKDILDGTTFGAELSAALTHKMRDAGARLLLIRKPGRAGQIDTHNSRRVFVAVTQPGAEKLYELTVDSPEDLLHLPLDAPHLLPTVGAQETGQTLALLCAHSKRDRCCAVFGRPIASALDAAFPDENIWECSHTGGHRFAPVAIFLPTGYTYGRLSPASARATFEALHRGDAPELEGLRGRSCYTPEEQVADLAVRSLLVEQGEPAGMNDLYVSRETPENNHNELMKVSISHTNGRSWVATTATRTLPEVYASCGKAPKPGKSVELVSLAETV